jgi:hypothetical protein
MKILFLTITSIILIGCSNDDEPKQETYNPQLPAITQVGANTFGCKIDGVVMVPRSSIGYLPPGSDHYPIIVSRGINYEYRYIQAADRRETQRGGVFLYFQNIPNQNYFSVGEYSVFEGISPSFLDDNYKNYIYVTRYKNGVAMNYKSVENSGKIIVTKSENAIFSGTFYCKVKNVEAPYDVIDITEGRFDFGQNINSTNFP